MFLHIRDFAERHKQPEVGDRIQFVLGQDDQGRPCARSAVHVNDGGRLTLLNLCILLSLLLLPAVALHRLALDFRWAAAYPVVIGLAAYAAYALDKRRARAGEWRVPEASLHLLELLGGWPGAFLAQRRLRHKCSKGSYQALFWLIVLAYQFAAWDSLNNWRLSRVAWTRISNHVNHRSPANWQGGT